MLCGLLSIGGGAYMAMFMMLYGRPIHQAVGTSAGFGPLVSIPGAIGFMIAGWSTAGLPLGSVGYVNLIGAAVIIPASVFTAPLGARLAHGISRRTLEIAFGCFLTLITLRYALDLMLG